MKMLCLIWNHAADEWKWPLREWFQARTQFGGGFRENFIRQ